MLDNHNDRLLLGGRKGNTAELKKSTSTRSIYTAFVISNDDPEDGGRIKARIPSLDKAIDSSSDILFAFPLFNKSNYILPKVGEAVLVHLSDVANPNSMRFWSGPITSQFQKMFNDQYSTALSLTDEAQTAPDTALSKISDADKIFPITKDDKENITQIGRDNTDIQHRRNKVRIRAGKHLTDKPTESNKSNPTYVNLRLAEDNSISSITSVGDYILLLSHKGDQIFDKDIDDKSIQNVIEKGNSILKAEPTIEFLKLLTEFMVQHTHRQNNISTQTETELAQKLLNFDFNTIFSPYHKIN